jgi:predicted lipoprotein with Yx(FWY)xxD motif
MELLMNRGMQWLAPLTGAAFAVATVIRNRSALLVLMALALSGLLLPGCGGSGSTNAGTGNETATDGGHAARAPVDDREAEPAVRAVDASRVAVVKTATTPDPVRVIVDSRGMTVYQFRRDDPMLYQFDRDPVPTCYGACSMTWYPLLTAERPRAADGADASMLGTIRRKDGGLQVTYDGHPLYLYAGDRRPGEMHGQEVDSFGANWNAVERDGQVLVAADR